MLKIIVVDDDPANITLIRMLLELDGFNVKTGGDVEQAIAMAEADTDAFVIDYHLARGANGLDLVRAIRSGETAAPSDAIILITSGDYRCEPESLAAGANLFLLKPYPPNMLSQEIQKLLQGGQ